MFFVQELHYFCQNDKLMLNEVRKHFFFTFSLVVESWVFLLLGDCLRVELFATWQD